MDFLFYLCSLFLFFSFPVFVFIPVPQCFDYCSFTIYFEIRKCEPSHFNLFQSCFSYSGSLKILYELLDRFFFLSSLGLGENHTTFLTLLVFNSIFFLRNLWSFLHLCRCYLWAFHI